MSSQRSEMPAQMVLWFVSLFERLGVRVWLDGGWGVDALIGEQTRVHADLDIMIPWNDAERLVESLRAEGFEDVPTGDWTPENFVLGHEAHGIIDFHVFEMRSDGSGMYKPGVADWEISASELDGRGQIEGVEVTCLSAEYQVRSHAGYALAETDLHDLRLLRDRFGVALLPEQTEALAADGENR